MSLVLIVVYTTLQVGPDNTLKSIDRTVVVASRFLKEYAADKRRQECLKAFTECQGIVEWIRNLGKGENTDKGIVLIFIICLNCLFLIIYIFDCFFRVSFQCSLKFCQHCSCHCCWRRR